jgi:hypothetical protein
MAAQWMPASPSLSAVSSVSSGSSVSSAGSASTSGSFAYVPPALRRARNTVRVELETQQAINDLASARKDATKHQGPKLPYFNLPYCLNKAQLSFLTSRFPRTTFKCITDVMHDHPIAHTETMIGMDKIRRMVPQGHRVIDLFGSPKDADKFNLSQARANVPKSMIAYCARMTEKDYIRALGWGSAINPDGSLRYVSSVTGDVVSDIDPHRGGVDPAFGVVDTSKLTYVSKHTLYYLSDSQIASLLRPTGSRMIALVHRHMGQQGTLFDGEASFGKISGCVEQVNKLTGERYVHRDLSWLWDSTSKVVRTDAGAFVWTFHMVSPETWIIELTGCPVGLDERLVSRARDIGYQNASIEMNEQSLSASRFPHPALATLPGATCVMVGGVPIVRFSQGNLPQARFTCPELFEYLATVQVGKPRDPERLNDLFSLARSHVQNGSEFPGKRNFRVNHDDIAGHVLLAYVAGLKNEVDLLRSVEFYRHAMKEHSALLDGTAISLVNPSDEPSMTGRAVLSVVKRANEIRKRSDVVTGLITALE